MNLRYLASSLAERCGYSLLPSWRLEALPLERHLRTLFAVRKIDAVIDVGANQGQYREFLRTRVGFKGLIHSFEPQPQLAAALVVAAQADPLWRVHHLALGAVDGELKLNIMRNSTFSSFKQPDHSQAPQFAQHNTVAEEVVVPVRRLDDLDLDGIGAPATVFLKCDTQGFDLEVMRGAPRLLKRAAALQFELAFRHIYADVPDYRSTLAEVEGLGFAISGFFPINADPQLRSVEMDCVMVRGDA